MTTSLTIHNVVETSQNSHTFAKDDGSEFIVNDYIFTCSDGSTVEIAAIINCGE